MMPKHYGGGGGIAPVPVMDQWMVNIRPGQGSTLPVSKPLSQTTYSSWRRVVDAYRQGLLTYAEAYDILIMQFGYEAKEADELLADPTVESTELDIPLDPGLQDAIDNGSETPQGMPNGSPPTDTLPGTNYAIRPGTNDAIGPIEEDRTQVQDRPWRDADIPMILLGGIAVYWVGRKVKTSF